jgi:hypothetical protein
MDKQLIEQCVAATAEEMDSFDNSGPGPGIHFFEPAELTEFVTRFLSRIDAERGYGPVPGCYMDEFGVVLCKAGQEKGMRLFLAPTIPEGWAQGVEAVAKMLDKSADDYAREYGHDDMGSLSFGSGSHAEAKREYHTYLIETAEAARSLISASQGERK